MMPKQIVNEVDENGVRWRSWVVLRGVPLVERLEMYTDKGGDCWLWTGAASSGYGRIKDDAPSKKQLLAHRVAYEAQYGPIPEGMEIDHRCHQKLCVRPEHLRTVTSKQNAEHAYGPTSKNKSGYLGVFQSSPNRWLGKVKHKGRDYYTGRFDTAKAAGEAVRLLRLQLFTHNDRDKV